MDQSTIDRLNSVHQQIQSNVNTLPDLDQLEKKWREISLRQQLKQQQSQNQNQNELLYSSINNNNNKNTTSNNTDTSSTSSSLCASANGISKSELVKAITEAVNADTSQQFEVVKTILNSLVISFETRLTAISKIVEQIITAEINKNKDEKLVKSNEKLQLTEPVVNSSSSSSLSITSSNDILISVKETADKMNRVAKEFQKSSQRFLIELHNNEEKNNAIISTKLKAFNSISDQMQNTLNEFKNLQSSSFASSSFKPSIINNSTPETIIPTIITIPITSPIQTTTPLTPLTPLTTTKIKAPKPIKINPITTITPPISTNAAPLDSTLPLTNLPLSNEIQQSSI